MTWDYGVGETGIHTKTTAHYNVEIRAMKMPWVVLYMTIANLKLDKVVLSEASLYAKLSALKCWGIDLPIKVNLDVKDLTRNEVLIIEGGCPSAKSKFWFGSPSLFLVVILCQIGRLPSGWKWKRIRISHWLVGGCTDNISSVTIMWKESQEDRLDLTAFDDFDVERIPQDLRGTLKSGIEGQYAVRPMDWPKAAQSVVKWYKQGEVLDAAGLFPMRKGWSTLVRTSMGGPRYTIRKVSLAERISILDVPEAFAQALKEESDTLEELAGEVVIPLKSMQMVMEIVGKLLASTWKRRKVEDVVQDGDSDKGGDTIGETLAQGVDRGVDKSKATRHDKAATPVHLWNDRVRLFMDPNEEWLDMKRAEKGCEVLRKWLLTRWKRNVVKSFATWERNRLNELGMMPENELVAGHDALNRVRTAEWFAWTGGSRAFFWRWPIEFRKRVLLGIPPWMHGKLEPWRHRTIPPADATTFKKEKEKLEDVIVKGYLEQGPIHSLTSFFSVPKGESDVRMVYDGTKSGLNSMLWAPWFPLPTVDDLLDVIEPGTFMCDNDAGEFFLNHMIHEDVRKLCGVDVTPYFPEHEMIQQGRKRVWLRWCRNAMGLRPSPYASTQAMMWAKEIIFGDRSDQANIFRWDRVVFNLPGMAQYNPARSWVRKVRNDGTLAADLKIYVDDMRPTGPTERECWEASQRISSMLGYLGNQDASRKRRPPSQQPGSWAGSDVHTDNGCVSVLVSREKWKAMQDIIYRLEAELTMNKGLDYKRLESDRGKLVYGTRGYPFMKPYLKGIHHTLESWRDDRDPGGWKQKKVVKKARLTGSRVVNRKKGETRYDEDDELDEYPLSDPFIVTKEGSSLEKRWRPVKAQPAPRLEGDLKVLRILLSGEDPAKVIARASHRVTVTYGFGDASGKGFGSMILLEDGSIFWQNGAWTTMIEEATSNYREFKNLVIALQRAAKYGHLKECEVFMFTDNSTAERAYFRGTSSSEHLFELILELRKLEKECGGTFYLIHIAGTRMIAQGTDGLSRGDQNAGSMLGRDMLDFVPLHKSALERNSKLKGWLQECSSIPECHTEFLSADRWFERHEPGGVYIWTPPPAGARVAIACLTESIHKRSMSTHILIAPRLMTAWWRKKISKSTDLTLTIPTNTPIWESHQHEPLLMCICLPLASSHPWRQGERTDVVETGRTLQGMWDRHFPDAGACVRQLICRARHRSDVSERMVPRMLSSGGDG